MRILHVLMKMVPTISFGRRRVQMEAKVMSFLLPTEKVG